MSIVFKNAFYYFDKDEYYDKVLKRTGISKIKRAKSIKTIAEERALRKYRNLRVLGSYFIGEDGSHKWIEVVLANPIIT